MLFYAPLAAFSYSVLGSSVPSNILTSVSGTAVTVVQALVAVDVMFVFIVVINPVMQGLEDTLNLPQGMKASFMLI